MKKEPIDQVGWGSDELPLGAEARGSYNPFRFLVQVRSDLYWELDAQPEGIFCEALKWEVLDSFGILFHETIHWWQHIGTTTGFLLSVTPLLQLHVNIEPLKKLLVQIGPQKPVSRLTLSRPGTYPREIEENANRIFNNWSDLDFNRRLILNPAKAADVTRSPYFESQGHSMEIALANLLLLLSATFDPNFEIVPDPRKWEGKFDEMRQRKLEGFYFGSQVKVGPIGAYQIFEGQARFSQIQYLYCALRGRENWEFFRNLGMLNGVYIEAFDWFLKWSGCEWPKSPTDRVVLLFLLVCDLALNPSDCYPFDLRHPESLIESVDPGIRFYWFSRQISKRPEIKNILGKCMAEEYFEAASILCKSMACATPIALSQELSRWAQPNSVFANLLLEESSSKYRLENLPLRVCMAKHLCFAAERTNRPEFFCWPGMFLIGREGVDLSESFRIFKKHQPPFLKHPSGEVRPSLSQGVPEENVYQTFNDFYYGLLLFDLVNQWVAAPGSFNLDYRWMHPSYTPDFTRPFADAAFKRQFGVSLEAVMHLSGR